MLQGNLEGVFHEILVVSVGQFGKLVHGGVLMLVLVVDIGVALIKQITDVIEMSVVDGLLIREWHVSN